MIARHRPRGFTLIELMVVIAVIGLLFALVVLLIPSRVGRIAARRTQCINNMRVLGLGLQQYLNLHGVFPNAGTYGEDPAALASGDPKDSVINDAFNGQFGRVRPGSPGVGPLRGWVVDILPYISGAPLYNEFNFGRPYFDRGRPGDDPTRPTNWVISSTAFDVLTCPDDPTLVNGAGNLSYVANGGFSLWHAPGHAYGWTGTPTGGTFGPALDWGQAVSTRTGVMFLGTHTGNAPWDVLTAMPAIVDGASNTLLLSENTRAGASPGNAYSGGTPTNWACPHPNFVMFLGSDDVCTLGARSGINCSTVGDLSPATGPRTGWIRANPVGTSEAINSATNRTAEGASPFPNSNHPGGIVVVMCDGSAKFISQAIDGEVWAKLITPAGGVLPPSYRQLPLNPAANPVPGSSSPVPGNLPVPGGKILTPGPTGDR
ncbi:MAG TPA: DUF1559 domain-containing protein [Isosphaeraceae bacterium]|jgi:prepilin-type N-terminal cleavage/methylation domain-containing protein